MTASYIFIVSLVADVTMCLLALVSVPYCFWRYGFWHGVLAIAASLVLFAVARNLLRAAFAFAVLKANPKFFD